MPFENERKLRRSQLPPRLADLPAPPPALYVRGELPRAPGVAIVGTRHPTQAAARFAKKLAGELARAGVCVLSGGAKGIDAAAHRGALAAAGATVVVAPCGFDRPYPPEHAKLFADVVRRGGAFVSLLPADEPATYASFFARNAVLVALAHAVVVVEAPARSGARNAAAHARRLGRRLFAVPSAPWNGRGLGCVLELQLGARPLASHRDVLASLAAERAHAVVLGPTPGPRNRAGAGAVAGDCRAGAGAVAGDSDRSRAGAGAVAGDSDRSRAGAGAVAGDSKRRPRSGTDPQSPRRSKSQNAGRLAEPVLEAVRQGARNADEICAQTGLAAADVQQRILTLALEGVLVSDLAGALRIVIV